VCFAGRIPGVAGPANFLRRLAAGLEARGVGVTYDPDDLPYAALLVIGGTRRLGKLARLRRRGVRVVQRLDGLNWIHRRRWTGPRHFVKAELANLVLRWIRARLADSIVYQSEFVRRWWEKAHGAAGAPSVVIHNGVALDRFSPHGPERPPADRIRLLVVEGNWAGGYEIGLDWARQMARMLAELASRPVELAVAGRVPGGFRQDGQVSPVRLVPLGVVPPEEIPGLDRSAHLLYAADLNPACPNSVIEALACGLPVVGFDTGALPELVTEGAGRLVPYGADPWRVELPDIEALARAAGEILEDPAPFRAAARRRAEAAFGLERMVADYMQAMGLDGGRL
jgi:glycosyltransferase involved in cell wall biosynthesis